MTEQAVRRIPEQRPLGWSRCPHLIDFRFDVVRHFRTFILEDHAWAIHDLKMHVHLSIVRGLPGLNSDQWKLVRRVIAAKIPHITIHSKHAEWLAGLRNLLQKIFHGQLCSSERDAADYLVCQAFAFWRLRSASDSDLMIQIELQLVLFGVVDTANNEIFECLV